MQLTLAVIVTVGLLASTWLPSIAEEEEPPPPPQMVGQTPQTAPKPDLPFTPLPRGRGHPQDHYLLPENLDIALPGVDDLTALSFPKVLDGLESYVPELNLDQLVPKLPIDLPPIDLTSIQSTVTDALAMTTEVVDGVLGSVQALGAGVAAAAQTAGGQETPTIGSSGSPIGQTGSQTSTSGMNPAAVGVGAGVVDLNIGYEWGLPLGYPFPDWWNVWSAIGTGQGSFVIGDSSYAGEFDIVLEGHPYSNENYLWGGSGTIDYVYLEGNSSGASLYGSYYLGGNYSRSSSDMVITLTGEMEVCSPGCSWGSVTISIEAEHLYNLSGYSGSGCPAFDRCKLVGGYVQTDESYPPEPPDLLETIEENNPVITTFNYTGGMQTYTVPSGVSRILVEALGGQGGGGGQGGRTLHILEVTPGTTYEVYVGGAGASPWDNQNSGGFPGGGDSGLGASPSSGGGGGASSVSLSGTPQAVAGGGGGVGGSMGPCVPFVTCPRVTGGAGGGGPEPGLPGGSAGAGGGGGASGTTHGSGGAGYDGGTSGGSGSSSGGGDGGDAPMVPGGGGWYAGSHGGGGGGQGYASGGGGGGSSFGSGIGAGGGGGGSGLGAWGQAGVHLGNGKVAITELPAVPPPNSPPAVPNLVTPPNGATFSATQAQVFTVSSTDPNGDPYRAEVAITNASTGVTNSFLTNPTASGQNSSGTPAPQLPPGSYTWKAKAIDAKGAESLESASRSFTVESALTTPVEFQLTTIANGLTQTFDLILCVPTPINIESTNQTTPSTLVSLCPVPLGIAGLIVPSVSQPLQLYLSVQRLPTGSAIPAKFIATYKVPNPTSPTNSLLTVNFGLVSTSQAYPNAIVGAATDYNPVTNVAAQTLTTSWALTGPADSIYVEAVGVGKVEVRDGLPAGSGSYYLSYIDGKFRSQFNNSAPLGANTDVVLSVQIPSTNPAVTNTGELIWTSIPQNFTFNFETTQVDGRPSAVTFDGTQGIAANPNFQVELNYRSNGAPVGHFKQTGFGESFEEKVQAFQDASGNFNGLSFHSVTGAYSTLEISYYKDGALAAFIELVHIPALDSQVTIQLEGTPGEASVGATITGKSVPDYIGAASYLLPLPAGGVSGSPQTTMELSTGLPAGPIPFAVGTGEKLHISVANVNPTYFTLKGAYNRVEEPSGRVKQTITLSGSATPGTDTASQLKVSAQLDLTHRGILLLNSMGSDWSFTVEGQGTDKKLDSVRLSVANGFDNPTELKQIYITESGTPLYTLTIQRPQSDMNGYISPAGVKVLAYNPPSNFDLTFQKLEQNGKLVGAVIKGVNHAPQSGGYVQIIVPEFWDATTSSYQQLSGQIDEPFQQTGDWSFVGRVLGKTTSQTEATTSYEIELFQSWGNHPDGELTLTQQSSGSSGGARMIVKSFSQRTKLTAKIFRDSTGTKLLGGRLEVTNSADNPLMEIHLDETAWGGWPQKAINVLGTGLSEAAAYEGSELTAIATKVPSIFELEMRHPNETSFFIESVNPQPAPDMVVKVFVSAARLVIKSFDQVTRVTANYVKTGGGLFEPVTKIHAELENHNLNPNTTQVISAGIWDASTYSYHTLLFWRPNGNISGLPSSGSNGGATVKWEGMPKDFKLTVDIVMPEEIVAGETSGDIEFTMDISLAQNAPDSVLRLGFDKSTHSPVLIPSSQSWNLVMRGTAAAQRLHLKKSPGDAAIAIDGNLPAAAHNIQLYHLEGDYDDKLVSIYRNGAVDTQGTQRGMELWVIPNSSADFDLSGKKEGKGFEVHAKNQVAGMDVDLSLYYQGEGLNRSYCIWDGSYLPCLVIHAWDIPATADLVVTVTANRDTENVRETYFSPCTITNENLPSEDGGEQPVLPTLTYTASDSNLRLWIESLTPQGSLWIGGIPKAGVKIALTGLTPVPGSKQQSKVSVSSADPNDPLPYFYMAIYNLEFEVNQVIDDDPGEDEAGGSGWFRRTGIVSMSLHYKGTIEIWGDAGIIKATAGIADGAIGVGVRGTANQRFVVGFQMSLTPYDFIAWQWQLHHFPSLAWDADEDCFVGEELDWGQISFYTWEAGQNDSAYQAATGCGGSTGNIDMTNRIDGWPWEPTIPFQPTFPLINNAIMVCAGHVAYYVISPQDLAFKHCRSYLEPCSNEFSYGDVLFARSDWILAAALKTKFKNSNDPATIWATLNAP